MSEEISFDEWSESEKQKLRGKVYGDMEHARLKTIEFLSKKVIKSINNSDVGSVKFYSELLFDLGKE